MNKMKRNRKKHNKNTLEKSTKLQKEKSKKKISSSLKKVVRAILNIIEASNAMTGFFAKINSKSIQEKSQPIILIKKQEIVSLDYLGCGMDTFTGDMISSLYLSPQVIDITPTIDDSSGDIAQFHLGFATLDTIELVDLKNQQEKGLYVFDISEAKTYIDVTCNQENNKYQFKVFLTQKNSIRVLHSIIKGFDGQETFISYVMTTILDKENARIILFPLYGNDITDSVKLKFVYENLNETDIIWNTDTLNFDQFKQEIIDNRKLFVEKYHELK